MKHTQFALTIFIALLIQACSINTSSEQYMPNQAIDPEGLFKVPGFHQVMVSTGNKTIYIAGQVAYDEEMNLIGMGDYRAQTIKAFQNVAVAVNAAGAKPEDIVSSTLHIKGLSTEIAQEIMEAMAVALEGKPFPAHAFNMIGVDMLADPRILIEVSAVAVVE
jgi:enamine deaminase RidA (YjgF/YER057c/UK114 family)